MADETNNCLTVLHFCASISLSLLSNMIVNDDEQRLASFVLHICISLCQFSPTLYRKLKRPSKKIEGSTGKITNLAKILQCCTSNRDESSCVFVWISFSSRVSTLQRNRSKTPWFNVLPNWPNCLNNLHIFFPWVFESRTVTKENSSERERVATQGSHDIYVFECTKVSGCVCVCLLRILALFDGW